MKIVLLGDVIFEGDEETVKAKYEEISKEMMVRLNRLIAELPKTYPKRDTDTDMEHFENLKDLSPSVYEDLSYIKDFFGDKFLKFKFNKEMKFAVTKVVTNIPQIHNFYGRKLLGKVGYNLIDLQMLFSDGIRSKRKERDIIYLEE